ncbi:MAG: CARDB domain-containing protein [Candidatus Hodarchaeota archaeon]
MKGKLGTVLIATLMIAAITPACIPIVSAEIVDPLPDLIVEEGSIQIYTTDVGQSEYPPGGSGSDQEEEQEEHQQPAGETYKLKAWVRNQADDASAGAFSTYFYIDDWDDCRAVVPHGGLGPGEGEWSKTGEIWISYGTHTVNVFVDGPYPGHELGQVDESNENNNSASVEITFEPQ